MSRHGWVQPLHPPPVGAVPGAGCRRAEARWLVQGAGRELWLLHPVWVLGYSGPIE